MRSNGFDGGLMNRVPWDIRNLIAEEPHCPGSEGILQNTVKASSMLLYIALHINEAIPPQRYQSRIQFDWSVPEMCLPFSSAPKLVHALITWTEENLFNTHAFLLHLSKALHHLLGFPTIHKIVSFSLFHWSRDLQLQLCLVLLQPSLLPPIKRRYCIFHRACPISPFASRRY